MSGNLIRHKAACATNATGHSFCDCTPDLIPIQPMECPDCKLESNIDHSCSQSIARAHAREKNR